MRKHTLANLLTAALALLVGPSFAFAAPVVIPRVLNTVSFPPVLSAHNPYGPGFIVLEAEGKPLYFRWGTIDEQFYPLPGTDWSASPYLTNTFRAYMSLSLYLDVIEGEPFPGGGGFLSRRCLIASYPPSSVMILMRDKIRDKFDNPNSGVQRLLLPILDRAAQQFRDGDYSGAIETVKKFQRTVKRRLQVSHPHFTKVLVSLSQAVIDTVTAGQ
jgi:hypothetical protein